MSNVIKIRGHALAPCLGTFKSQENQFSLTMRDDIESLDSSKYSFEWELISHSGSNGYSLFNPTSGSYLEWDNHTGMAVKGLNCAELKLSKTIYIGGNIYYKHPQGSDGKDITVFDFQPHTDSSDVFPSRPLVYSFDKVGEGKYVYHPYVLLEDNICNDTNLERRENTLVKKYGFSSYFNRE